MYTTIKELTNAVKDTSKDPDPKGTAQRLFMAPHEGKQDIACYLTDFVRLSKRLNITEETKIWSLCSGLAPGLKEEIRKRDEPYNMQDLVDL